MQVSHRNPKVKEVMTQHNDLLYAVPYQHFTNSIENYFSMLKSRLQKLDKYRNIIKGAYERPIKTTYERSRRTIYKFSYKMGVLNEKRCK